MKSSEENVSINLIDFIYQENNNLNQAITIEFEENNVSELHMHKILYLLFGLFLSLIHISEPTRQPATSRMPSSA